MKKGKLAIIIISGLIGVGIIGNMLNDGSKNNDISKNQGNELPKVEQKAEKNRRTIKK